MARLPFVLVASADEYLAEVRSHIGVTEHPAGSNCQPFSHQLGRPCERWCADFLVACARKVGLVLPSESASTITMGVAFQDAGAWHTSTPEPGDYAFFDFPDTSHVIQHVEVVERLNADGTLTDIGGNTASDDGGSQSNGGGVYRRVRSRKFVVGFGRPAYTLEDDMPWTDTDSANLAEAVELLRDINHHISGDAAKGARLPTLMRDVDRIADKVVKPD